MSDYLRHLGGIGYEKVRAFQTQIVFKRGRLRKKEVEALLRDLGLVFDAIKHHGQGAAGGYSGAFGNPYSSAAEMLAQNHLTVKPKE